MITIDCINLIREKFGEFQVMGVGDGRMVYNSRI